MSRHPFARPRGWSWRSYTCHVCEGKGWELKDGIGVPCRFCLGMVKMSLTEIANRLPTVTRAMLSRVARSLSSPPRRRNEGGEIVGRLQAEPCSIDEGS